MSGTAPAHSNEYDVRVDHNINATSNAYFHYSYKEEFKTGAAADWGNDPAGPGNARPNNRWGMWAGYTKIFSPTFDDEPHLGRPDVARDLGQSVVRFRSHNPWPSVISQSRTSRCFPESMSAASRLLGPGANDQQAVTNHGPIGTVSADFVKLLGKHTLNFGWTGVEQIFGQHPYFQD